MDQPLPSTTFFVPCDPIRLFELIIIVLKIIHLNYVEFPVEYTYLCMTADRINGKIILNILAVNKT